MPHDHPRTTLRLYQQNLNRSQIGQVHLLNTLNPSDHDIVLLQEPWINPHTNLTQASSHWRIVYPTGHHDRAEKTRSVIFVSKNVSTDSWYAANIDNPDLTCIIFHTHHGPLYIYNIYNDQHHARTLTALREHLDDTLRHYNTHPDILPPNHTVTFLIAGDINRHHPFWELPNNSHLLTRPYLDAAQPVVDILSDYGLFQLLPAALPTLRANGTGNLTRPDNVFGSNLLMDMLVSCKPLPERRPPCCDHFPIHTVLSLDLLPPHVEGIRWNWRGTDPGMFESELRAELEARDFPTGPIGSAEELDATVDMLIDTIYAVRDRTVPRAALTPFTKRWWSKELALERKQVQKLGRTSYRHRHLADHPSHSEYKRARNRYGDNIQRAKRDHWQAYLEGVNEESIWNFSRYVKGGHPDGSRARVPPLKRTKPDGSTELAHTNDEKSTLLFENFFPQGPEPEEDDDADPAESPPMLFKTPRLTLDLVSDIIKTLPKFKAPGPDGIPNAAYVWGNDLLSPHLLRIFHASFTVRHRPTHYKRDRTVVLRKPNRPDYSSPNAFRPITLGQTMAKIEDKCVTHIIMHELEKRDVLPRHFLGRPGRTTTDALHFITMTVKNALRTGKVASALFLDIKAAFPSVNSLALFKDLRRQGIPPRLTGWLKRKMTGRVTTLEFDDYVSPYFPLPGCLEQGCPMSVALYLMYNAPMLGAARADRGEFIAGNIDDVIVLTIGDTYDDTHGKLRSFMTRPGGAFEWSTSHTSAFSVEKFGLLNFSAKQRDRGLGPALILGPGHPVIEPAKSYKFLGVHIDHRLSWQIQIDYALNKGLKWVTLFKRMAATRHGIPPKMARRLYFSIAIPAMLYAADVFLVPLHQIAGKTRMQGSVGAIRKLGRVHRQALLMMTGAMKTTATDILEAHTNVPPFPLIVEKICYRGVVRICTLPPPHPLVPLVKRAASRPLKCHRSTLHTLLHYFQTFPDTVEKIPAYRKSPLWTPGMNITIDATKDAAIARDESLALAAAEPGRRVRVYTDGSDHDGGVGAAAILYRHGIRRVLRFHLGDSTKHTVYEAELVGIILALELVRQETAWVSEVSIALDNQAAVTSCRLKHPGPGCYLLDRIHELKRAVKKAHGEIKISIRWVPGHTDVEGNEDADVEAKTAAEGHSSAKKYLPKCLRHKLPTSASRLRQNKAADITAKAKTAWEGSPRYTRFQRIDTSLPSKTYEALTDNLPRRHAALLIQLHTGHAPLHKHLHRINCVPSPTCPACEDAPETVEHYLLYCQAHERARFHLYFDGGPRTRSLTALLGDRSLLRPLFRYIHRTGRFKDHLGDAPVPDVSPQAKD